MASPSVVSSAFIRSTLLGTTLQLAMVLVGHWIAAVANLFGIIGITISFGAGWLFGRWASGIGRGKAAAGGAAVGGLCAILGIAISVALGDVPPVILVVGTASSAATGLAGGLLARRRVRAAPAG